MSEWPEVRIADHASIDIGGTPSRAIPAFWAEKPSGYPWISIADLKGKFVSDTKEHITALGVRSSNVKLIPEGTTVMSFKLSVGRTAITAAEMYCNEAIAIFQPKDRRLDGRWLYHALPLAAGSVVTDTAVKGATLNKAKMAEMTLRLPSPAEQTEIAEVLDTLDTAIHETEAIIAKLQAVKQGMLHDLLTRGIDANGELRPPQDEAPQLYKESPLGWIPKEWDACELNSLVDPARPVVYGILMPGYGHPSGVPVVKVKDIIDDAIQLDNLLLTNPQIDREYSRSRLRLGDLLFTIRGTVGRMAIVPEQLKDANITQDTARLAIKSNDARFVKACLSMHAAARFIAVNTLGVAVQGINLRDVRRIPLPRPGSDEAREIADRLDGTTQRLACETRALNKLTLAKAGLKDDLLTGRVRVTPLLAGAEREKECA